MSPLPHPIRRARPALRDRQRGAVLLIVLMLMVTLLGLGMTALWVTNGNLEVGGNINQRAQALYVAQAGMERARAILNATAPSTVSALLKASGNLEDDVPTSLDADGLPAGAGAILLSGPTALRNIVYPPSTFGRTAGTASAPRSTVMGSYTVWVRNDTGECRLGKFLTDSNATVVVRSRGMAPDNRTSVVIEAVMGPLPGGPDNGGTATYSPVLCNFGKNGCDDNSNTIGGLVAN
jgi:Tfp pilus assembly protein PilX